MCGSLAIKDEFPNLTGLFLLKASLIYNYFEMRIITGLAKALQNILSVIIGNKNVI